MNKYFLILLIILKANSISAQDNFRHIFRATNSYFFTSNETFSIRETADSGYAFIYNTTDSNITINGFTLVKMNKAGNLQWSRQYSIPGYPNSVDFDEFQDGSFAVAEMYGYSIAYFHLDSAGNLMSAKSFLPDSSMMVYSCPIQLEISTENNRVFFTHLWSNNFNNTIFNWILSTDSSGNAIWSNGYKYLGFDNIQAARSFTLNKKNECLAASIHHYTDSISHSLLEVFKTDSLGNTKWYKRFGPSSYSIIPRGIVETSDGEVLVSGRNQNTPYGNFLLKLDSLGNIIWCKSYGLPVTYGYGVEILENGNYIFYSNRTPGTICTILDTAGSILSNGIRYPNVLPLADAASTSSGSLLLGFYGGDSLIVISSDSLGNAGCNEFAYTMQEANVILYDSSGYSQIPIMFASIDIMDSVLEVPFSIQMTNECDPTSLKVEPTSASLSIAPSPFTSTFTVRVISTLAQNKRLTVFNNLGKEVSKMNVDGERTEVDLSECASGIYFVKVDLKDGPIVEKVIKLE